jgi:hypothetical protein
MGAQLRQPLDVRRSRRPSFAVVMVRLGNGCQLSVTPILGETMIPLSRIRIALLGAWLWLIPTLSLAVWYGGTDGALVPYSWLVNALCVLVAGLGAWVLLLAVLYRGVFPYFGALLGTSWVVLSVAMDGMLHLSSGSIDWTAYLLANGPTDAVFFIACVGLGQVARRVAPART